MDIEHCPNCQNHITKESLQGMMVCGRCVELVGEERIIATQQVRIKITHRWRQKYVVRMMFEQGDYTADLLKMREGWHYELLCADLTAPSLDPGRLQRTGANLVASGDASTPMGIIADALDAIAAHQAGRPAPPAWAGALMQLTPLGGGLKD